MSRAAAQVRALPPSGLAATAGLGLVDPRIPERP
jgi:hypothetical protein